MFKKRQLLISLQTFRAHLLSVVGAVTVKGTNLGEVRLPPSKDFAV